MNHRKRVSLYFIILAVMGVSCLLYPTNAQKIDRKIVVQSLPF
ncbi:hypothetical protein [Okeania sp. SIO1I7]|nr:hypothetical protein [Okeania sp. SIO1I7]